MSKVNLEFYVLNHNFNARKVEMFNIFRNHYVYERTIEYVKQYLNEEIDYETLKIKIGKAIQYEEWSRCEYEIMVGDLFEQDPNKFEKWDCYEQAIANIEVITDMAIKRVKEAIENE